jgi:hypothetical protein
MESRISKIFEGLVTLVIFLVLIHTLAEDIAVIFNLSDIVKIFLYTAFFFDLFFTIEFLTRLYNGLAYKTAGRYFFYEKGWIDFLASIPLLIFISGPNMLSKIFGGVVMFEIFRSANLLKLIKALRITRILRLLRVLKIAKVKYTGSQMTHRHISKIITISVTIIIFFLIGYAIFMDNLETRRTEMLSLMQKEELLSFLEKYDFGEEEVQDDIFKNYLDENYNSTLLILKNGRAVYGQYSKDDIENNFKPEDLLVLESVNKKIVIYFDIQQEAAAQNAAISEQRQSFLSLIFFGLILLIILVYALIYSPHFAMTVTDPIHVMKRGMSEPDYNLEVKIPDTFKNDDVFQLARIYNERYLPLKDRSLDKENTTNLQLDMSDIKDMLDEE